MKIGIISASVFPINKHINYGGLEKLVFWHCKAIGELGIDCTLIAPKGSYVKNATIWETIDPPMRWGDEEKLAYEAYRNILHEFDVLHDHSHHGLPYKSNHKSIIHTLHGLTTWAQSPTASPRLVSLSKFHREDTYNKLGHWSEIIGMGIDYESYPYTDKKEDYVLSLGLIAPHKNHEFVIDLCSRLNQNLIVCGESNFVPDPKYVEYIKSKCEKNNFIFKGSINEKEKIDLIANAKCVILPFKIG